MLVRLGEYGCCKWVAFSHCQCQWYLLAATCSRKFCRKLLSFQTPGAAEQAQLSDAAPWSPVKTSPNMHSRSGKQSSAHPVTLGARPFSALQRPKAHKVAHCACSQQASHFGQKLPGSKDSCSFCHLSTCNHSTAAVWYGLLALGQMQSCGTSAELDVQPVQGSATCKYRVQPLLRLSAKACGTKCHGSQCHLSSPSNFTEITTRRIRGIYHVGPQPSAGQQAGQQVQLSG